MAAAAMLLGGCNVSSTATHTGGVKPGDGGGATQGGDGATQGDGGGATQGDGGGAMQGDGGACEQGVVIVSSDYTSTDVTLSSLEGVTESSSFVSSGSTEPGLALALSGDVDVPVVAPASGRVVTIDRYGTNVLTWLDPATANVLAQLPVGTGFESNPHDYLEVDATRAYVTRYGTNATPGVQPYDHGGDLLIVDTAKYAILGDIAIPEEDPTLQPCPDGMTWLGGDVIVNLQRLASDYSHAGDGRFIAVSPSTDSIVWTVQVTGLQSCGRVAVSPSGKVAAIACSSEENATTSMFDPAKSDIVIYDATTSPPTEVRRLGLGVSLNAGIQPSIAFAAEDTILAMTYGGNATPGDTAFAVSASTATVTPLLTETQALALGAVHCSPGCSNVCLVSDSVSSSLKRWQVGATGALTPLADESVDPDVGLPPRSIGGLQ